MGEMENVPIDWGAELDANRSWLERVIYARVRDPHAVSDILQELGIAALTWPERLCGNEAVNRWLYVAAAKQSMRYCRTRTRDIKKTKRYADQLPAQNEDDEPMRALLESENANWVKQALDQISNRQREILLLKYFESWTCAQISDHFQIAEGTVRRQLVTARKRLRQELRRLRNDAD